VSSNKGQLGHTISAAGVCNVIATAKSIAEGVIPPTMHLKNADPACDLDYVPNQSRRQEVRAAIANAFAFGGENAVLALKACNT
jgi:3-oxoacyl-[acyl-carrier-protein] synthase II